MKKQHTTIDPRCPFCTSLLPRPVEVEPKRLADFGYGQCECGAVFVFDITGYNLGAAMVEALNFACNDDWDLAWSLLPGEDYQDALIEGYDHKEHRVYPSGHDYEGNRVKGALSFIRLLDDVREVTAEGVKRKLSGPVAVTAGATSTLGRSKGQGRKKRFSKREVSRLVKNSDLQRLIDMAFEDRLVISKIQRLLYSADEHMMWNAVVMLGAVAGAIVPHDPTFTGDLMRRLLHAANDSAAMSRGCIEVAGEIIRNQPGIYGSFVRHILGLLPDQPSRPAILWAIGRIGELNPELVKKSSFFVLFDLLDSEDADVRGRAVWALNNTGAFEAESAIRKMQNDNAQLTLFDGKTVRQVTVGELAQEAVKKFEQLKEGRVTEMNENFDNGAANPEPATGADGNSAQTDKDKEIARARALHQEGSVLKNRGQSLDALAKLEEALATFEEHGLVVEAANACELIGDLHIMRGNFKSALAPYQRTLAICQKKGDDISEVLMIEKVIDVYRQLKEYKKALPYYFRGLELVEELSDVSRSGMFLAGIGDAYERLGNIEDALDAYRLAERLFRKMGAKERADVLLQGIKTLEENMHDNASG
jgi:tetratricopeptide (TPR) repeat protein